MTDTDIIILDPIAVDRLESPGDHEFSDAFGTVINDFLSLEGEALFAELVRLGAGRPGDYEFDLTIAACLYLATVGLLPPQSDGGIPDLYLTFGMVAVRLLDEAEAASGIEPSAVRWSYEVQNLMAFMQATHFPGRPSDAD